VCVYASKILFSCPLNRLRSGSTIAEMEYMRNRTNMCILKTYLSFVVWKNLGGGGVCIAHCVDLYHTKKKIVPTFESMSDQVRSHH